jgi:hypothetical protein
VSAYVEAWREWLVTNQHNRDTGRTADPYPQPDQVFYEAMYRNARQQLRSPQPKSLRKHFQKQLWAARACLKQYFGAEPPAE